MPHTSQDIPTLTTAQLVTRFVGSLHSRDWTDEPDPDQAQTLRATLYRELVQRGSAVVADLLPYLSDPDWAVRDDIASLFGHIKHPAAIPALARILQTDDSRAVRAQVRRALISIGTPVDKYDYSFLKNCQKCQFLVIFLFVKNCRNIILVY